MVITASGLRNDVNQIISNYGQLIRFKYYNASGANSSYDDDVTLVQSGTSLWISGLVIPIDLSEVANLVA